jgi:hypothetical protein
MGVVGAAEGGVAAVVESAVGDVEVADELSLSASPHRHELARCRALTVQMST